MTSKLLVINPKDNVAIALVNIFENQLMQVKINRKGRKIYVKQNIRKGHKIALNKISKGQAIIKYGEIIGYAKRDIFEGTHVHVQNLVGKDEMK